MKPANKSILAVVIVAFLFAIQGVLFRYIGTDFGSFYPFVIRGILIVLVLTALLLKSRDYKAIQKKDYFWFILMPLSGVVSVVSFFVAVNHISIGNAIFLHYASFVIVGFVLGRILFNEKVNLLKLLSFTLSFAGLLLIFAVPQLQKDILFLGMAFLSGIGSSLWYLSSKKITDKYSYTQILLIDSLVLAIVSAIIGLSIGEVFHAPVINIQWISVVLLTVISLVIFYLVLYGYRYLEAHIASLILLLEVVFGLIVGWLMYAEVPGIQAMIGGVLITMGAALPNLKPEKKN